MSEDDDDALAFTPYARPPVAPLPFGVRLVIVFLAVDAIERIVDIVRALAGGSTLDLMAGQLQTLPRLVALAMASCWVLVNVLLALLLAFRLEAGRIWACVAFGLHLVTVMYYAAHNEPHHWVALTDIGRIRILTTAAIDGAVVAYLCARSTREAIDA